MPGDAIVVPLDVLVSLDRGEVLAGTGVVEAEGREEEGVG